MSVPQSPSEELSSQIADALIASGLLRSEMRQAIVEKVAGGGMTGLDWKAEIVAALDMAVKS
jgi:hypothetical protein